MKQSIAIFSTGMLLLTMLSGAFLRVSYAQAADMEDIQSDIKKTEKELEAAKKKEALLKQDLNQITGSLVVTKQVIAKTSNLLSDTETIIGKEGG